MIIWFRACPHRKTGDVEFREDFTREKHLRCIQCGWRLELDPPPLGAYMTVGMGISAYYHDGP